MAHLHNDRAVPAKAKYRVLKLVASDSGGDFSPPPVSQKLRVHGFSLRLDVPQVPLSPNADGPFILNRYCQAEQPYSNTGVVLNTKHSQELFLASLVLYLLRILKQQDGEVTAFSEKLWCGLLDYATAYADGRLTFTFKNGSTFES